MTIEAGSGFPNTNRAFAIADRSLKTANCPPPPTLGRWTTLTLLQT
jgi:hypothetical protein